MTDLNNLSDEHLKAIADGKMDSLPADVLQKIAGGGVQSPSAPVAPVAPVAPPTAPQERSMWNDGFNMTIPSMIGGTRNLHVAPKEIAHTVKNMGLEGGGATLGQVMGAPLAEFGGVQVGGAIGGFLGNSAAQLTTPGKDYKLGEALAAGAAGMVPGASLAKAGAKEVGKQALKLGAANLAATNIESLVDTGKPASLGKDIAAFGTGVVSAPISKYLDKGMRAEATRVAAQQGALKRETLKAGRELGLVVPPSAVAPNPVNDSLQSLAGKAAVAQESIIRNQPKINAAVRAELALPFDAPITPISLNTAKTGPHLVYDGIAKTSPEAAGLLKAFKDAQDRARELFAAHRDTPNNMTLSAAKAADAEADAFKAGLKKVVSTDLFAQFDAARTQLAKIGLAERALNKGSGDIDIKVLGQALDNGEKLTGNFSKLGKFQNAFAKYAQDAVSAPPSGVDWLKGMTRIGVGGGAGYSAGGPLGAAAGIAAVTAAERGARSGILTPFYQKRFAQPFYGATTEDLPAGIARLGTMQAGRSKN